MVFWAACATAADEDTFRPRNGITELDLLGDGTPAMVIVGHRENFNAHSFDVVSLLLRLDDQWQVVPVYDAEKELDSLTSSGGADCLLHDFRLVRRRAMSPLALVVADREFGDSFFAVRPVAFRVYELKRNQSSQPGAPRWSFQLRSTRMSSTAYCDVGEAFARESIWKDSFEGP
jgi:hypothetical protein